MKRVVDVHHHWYPPALVADIESFLPPGYSGTRGAAGGVRVFDSAGRLQVAISEGHTDAATHIRAMDAAGVDLAVLSAGRWPSWITLPAARLLNDAGAELQIAYPGRFLPLAHVPPFGEEGGLEELERCARDLGLRGVCIASHYRDQAPDSAAFRPFLCRAAALGMPVFIHPATSPIERAPIFEPGGYGGTFGRSTDLCLLTARLLFGGVMEAIPDLRLIIAHLGGSFVFNLRRLLPVGSWPPPEPFQRLLDRVLFDTGPSLWYGPEEIACAAGILGARVLALGSDFPMNDVPTVLTRAIDHVRALPCSPEEKDGIAGANALDFFGVALTQRPFTASVTSE